MLLEVLFAWADHLSGNHLVPSLLESGDDVADESSLDAIWLDCDEAGILLLARGRPGPEARRDSRLLGRHLNGCIF